MDEPKAKEKKYTHCARCGAELGEEYYYYADNYLQVKYFDEQDGSDNAFCSEACAGYALILTTAENVKEAASDGEKA